MSGLDSVKLQKLPKEFEKPRKEPNLLTYKDFQILVEEKEGEITGSVRLGISLDEKSGLITDLWSVEERVKSDESLKQLISAGEKELRRRGLKKIDAYYLDGPGRLSHYYSMGYIPERRTVEIEWDLTKNQKSKIISKRASQANLNQNYNISKACRFAVKVKSGTKDKGEIEELFKNSFQPYWVAPYDFEGKKFFVAYEKGKTIGMVDQNLEIGVVIRKGYGGKGLGSSLLNTALMYLKDKGRKTATILATSGLDDYDPQIYLYTMNGGKIVREYINLNKTF